jgi:hypothetical protein
MSKKYHRGENTNKVYEAEQVKENTEIKTQFGTVVVTAGNYIFTDKDGNKFGVSALEVDDLYTPVEKSKAKEK